MAAAFIWRSGAFLAWIWLSSSLSEFYKLSMLPPKEVAISILPPCSHTSFLSTSSYYYSSINSTILGRSLLTVVTIHWFNLHTSFLTLNPSGMAWSSYWTVSGYIRSLSSNRHFLYSFNTCVSFKEAWWNSSFSWSVNAQYKLSF